MKTVEFFCIEDDKTGDLYAIADYELLAIGKTKDELNKEMGGRGGWRSMTLKPATAKLERDVRALCLTGNEMMGFRADESLLPGARFQVVVEKWWSEEAPTIAAYDAMPPNLADRVHYSILKHLRPNMADNPDFFKPSSGS
jgi:hypothetical protein